MNRRIALSPEDREKAGLNAQRQINELIEVRRRYYAIPNNFRPLNTRGLHQCGPWWAVGSPQAVDEDVSFRAEFVDLVQRVKDFSREVWGRWSKLYKGFDPVAQGGLRHIAGDDRLKVGAGGGFIGVDRIGKVGHGDYSRGTRSFQRFGP